MESLGESFKIEGPVLNSKFGIFNGLKIPWAKEILVNDDGWERMTLKLTKTFSI